MRSALPVLLVVLFAGCATVPDPAPSPATGATPSPAPTPVPSPPGPGPVDRMLFEERFDASLDMLSWTQGFWNPEEELAGTHSVSNGALRFQIPPSGPAAHALARPLDVRETATLVTATAVVEAASLDRYGIHLTSSKGWVGLEFDYEGFILGGMDSQGQHVDVFAPVGRLGERYTLQLSVSDRGLVTATVLAADGSVVGTATSERDVIAPEVGQLWVGVWDSPFATSRSDYATHEISAMQRVAG